MLSPHSTTLRASETSARLIPNILGLPFAERSEAARAALEARCQREPVPRIEFSSRGGLGFRAIQAKRAGLAFANTILAVRLDGTAAQDRVRGRRLMSHLDEVEEEFVERYAFENADERLINDSDLMDLMRARGWSETGTTHSSANHASGLVTVCVPHYNLGLHLPQALASIACQDHDSLQVIVIDDGSTDELSKRTFDAMEICHPEFIFVRQANAGIGATRNRGLAMARGDYFLPVDADNILRPNMISTLVKAMRPGLAALSCYFLAFEQDEDITAGRFLYAGRPMGGPFALSCWKNVYGDSCSLFRTADFRRIGGNEEDRGTSFEDWEAFVKLAGQGFGVDVVPDHLFYYRHLAGGFSRVTDSHANLQRVLRQFKHADRLPLAERELTWQALAGLAQQADQNRARESRWPFRLARRAWDMVRWIGGSQGRRPSG